jgi:hypothetical protein
LALVDERENRIEDARAHFTEDLSIYRGLARRDRYRYSGYVNRVQASLDELDKQLPSK